MSQAQLRFAVYCRVSTPEQAERGESLPAQEEELTAAVKSLGGVVVRVFSQPEHAVEGSDRASLLEVFDFLESGGADAVMVRDQSRLTRYPLEWEMLVQRLLKSGKQVFEGTKPISVDTPEGMFMSRIFSATDAFAVQRMKSTAAKSRLSRARRGWPHSGNAPFGRILANPEERVHPDANARWTLDESKLALVRTMYELYIEKGSTLIEVGRRVGQHPETVRRILLNQSGDTWVCQFKEPGKPGKVRIEIPVPPLLSAVEIARVAARAKENQLERAGWDRRSRGYPLSHFIRCGNPECGWSNFSGRNCKSRGKALSYYLHLPRSRKAHCATSIRADEIERCVLAQLGTMLRDSSVLEVAIRAAVGSDKDSQGHLARREKLKNEVEAAKGRIARLLRAVAHDADEDVLRLRQLELERAGAQLKDLRDELKSTEAAIGVLANAEVLESHLVDLRRQFKAMGGMSPILWPYEAQRQLMRLFFGQTSARFLRDGRHQKSDRIGIFVSRRTSDWGEQYWVYEARGRFATVMTGALTDYEHLQQLHDHFEGPKSLAADELRPLVAAVGSIPKERWCKVSQWTSRRWSA
jgi:DNA invertase Pin-like site-specific DNA recombinase